MLSEDKNHKEPEAEAAENKVFNWKKWVLITLAVMGVLIVILAGCIFLYVDHLLGLVVGPDDHSTSTYDSNTSSLTLPPEETLPPDHTYSTILDATMPTVPAPPIAVQEKIINIMLLGEDDKDGYYRGRTDSMILCTINTKAKTITMTSFMRDTYVTIPGYGENRLNAAYVFGGYDLFRETMKWNFGVELDDIVKVELGSFAAVVDILGGVDITLTQAEVNHLNECTDWNLSAGKQRLNGEQALAYSRIRKIDSDFYRTQRQQKVLSSIFEAYKNKSFGDMLAVTEEILPLISVTMNKQDMYGYMMELFPLLSGCSVVSQRVPADGTYRGVVINGMAVLLVDLEANRQLLEEIMNP